jgi:hypothetical protein
VAVEVGVAVAVASTVGVGAGRVGDMQLTRERMVVISKREKNTRRKWFVIRTFLDLESLLYTVIISSTYEFIKPKQVSTDSCSFWISCSREISDGEGWNAAVN